MDMGFPQMKIPIPLGAFENEPAKYLEAQCLQAPAQGRGVVDDPRVGLVTWESREAHALPVSWELVFRPDFLLRPAISQNFVRGTWVKLPAAEVIRILAAEIGQRLEPGTDRQLSAARDVQCARDWR